MTKTFTMLNQPSHGGLLLHESLNESQRDIQFGGKVTAQSNYLNQLEKASNHNQSLSQFNSTAYPFMSQQLKNNNFTEKIFAADK